MAVYQLPFLAGLLAGVVAAVPLGTIFACRRCVPVASTHVLGLGTTLS